MARTSRQVGQESNQGLGGKGGDSGKGSIGGHEKSSEMHHGVKETIAGTGVQRVSLLYFGGSVLHKSLGGSIDCAGVSTVEWDDTQSSGDELSRLILLLL